MMVDLFSGAEEITRTDQELNEGGRITLGIDPVQIRRGIESNIWIKEIQKADTAVEADFGIGFFMRWRIVPRTGHEIRHGVAFRHEGV